MTYILLVREPTRDDSGKWIPVDSGSKKHCEKKATFWAECGDETKVEKLQK